MNIHRLLILPGLLGAILLSSLSSEAQTTVTKIAAGLYHSLFVKSDGSLWAVGYNYDGELGDGSSNLFAVVPEMIVSNGVTAVYARNAQSFFQTGGLLWAMGDNALGQLGDGTTNGVHVPERITNCITVGAGFDHTLFTRNVMFFRELDAMGYNVYGALGDGTTNNASRPERIEGDSTLQIGGTPVTAVAAGLYHSLVVKSDGSLWAMGADFNGQLGDGHFFEISTNQMEKVVSSGVTTVAAGYFSSYFIKTDGSLWAMGANDFGQLGDPKVGGLGSSTNLPTMVVASNVVAVSAGNLYALFTKSDGSLWGMGYNTSGQLGDGTFNSTNQPEKIVTAGVTAVSAGIVSSLFLESDGSLWGMGQNFEDQLGTTPSVDCTNPVQIVGPIVANGGFESDDFLGWTRTGNFSQNHIVTNTAVAHSGFAAATMGTIGGLSFISQMVNTVPGTSYLISFWLKSDGGQPNEFFLAWNNTDLIDTPNLADGTWFKVEYTVTATSTFTPIKFGFRDDPGFLSIDDISVVPLIQPVITGITLAGTNLILNASNGQWNGTYATLMSTNLAQPFFSWTPVATNVLDGSGNFTVIVTNGVSSTVRQRFYTLQLQ